MKKIISLLLAIIFLLSFSGCQNPGKVSYNKGLASYAEADYQKARDYFETALSQGFSEGIVYADLALSLWECKETEEALLQMEKALDGDSGNARVLKKAGILSMKTGDYNQAITYFDACIEHVTSQYKEDVLEAYGLAAYIEMEHECYDEALRLYNYLIEQGDHVVEHTLLAGICYLHLNQFSAAKAYFDLLLDNEGMTPYHYLTVYNICLSYEEAEEAEMYLDRGKTLIESGAYELTLSEYYAAAGMYEEALKEAEGKETAGDYLAMASVYVHQEEYEKAKEKLNLLFSLEPDSEEGYLLYFISLIQTGKYEDARQVRSKLSDFDNQVLQKNVAWNEIILYEKMRDYKTAYDKIKTYMLYYQVDENVRKELAYLAEQSE